MQSYSNPDLFFCPLYNRPGMSDPKMNLCGSEEDTQLFGTTGSSAGSHSSSSPTSPCSSTNSSQTSSRSSSPSPSSASERKLHKYKRMSAKAGKSLLDFATEVESRRIVHEKRKQYLECSRQPSSCCPSGAAANGGAPYNLENV
ncbi:hypothetical protein OH76DRAFT_1422907 [Lentinus brumalis]|uniref:Uncharacterized protein n=1 Tax=Lentinus brumalis TaxID=2498619 RepID=A0A371CNC9_9APHY|nr:hypothetical protein OH76DRAFT_1422907 [Polyporus brumalis]